MLVDSSGCFIVRFTLFRGWRDVVLEVLVRTERESLFEYFDGFFFWVICSIDGFFVVLRGLGYIL